MNKQVLTTNDVTIKQVEVSIQVLKIGNKQVTQAVFKQLLEELIINPNTGELRGEAWGRVNYHVGCDDFGAPHFHVVWQKGNELRRCTVALPWECYGYGYKVSTAWGELMTRRYKIAEAYLAALLLEGYDPGGDSPFECNVSIAQTSIHLNLSETIRHAWWATRYNGTRVLSDRQALECMIKERFLPMVSEEIEGLFIGVEAQLSNIRHMWQQSYDQLAQLDQLFIAV